MWIPCNLDSFWLNVDCCLLRHNGTATASYRQKSRDFVEKNSTLTGDFENPRLLSFFFGRKNVLLCKCIIWIPISTLKTSYASKSIPKWKEKKAITGAMLSAWWPWEKENWRTLSLWRYYLLLLRILIRGLFFSHDWYNNREDSR